MPDIAVTAHIGIAVIAMIATGAVVALRLPLFRMYCSHVLILLKDLPPSEVYELRPKV